MIEEGKQGLGALAGNKRRRGLIATALAPLAGIAPRAASQSTYPDRTIALICPFVAGGATDIAVRALADGFGRALGNKRVVVDNRPGAGGSMGAQFLAQNAKPDGYTLAQNPLPVFRLPYLIKTTFNPLTDLTYLIGVAGYNFGLTVRSDAPWKSWQELIADARGNPGKIRYGSPGIGTSLHTTMEDIAIREKIQFTHVPYKGSAQTIAALLGGEVDAMAGSPPWELIDAGKARALSTWSANRSPKAPDVPTLKELYGIVANSPWGIVGPKGMEPQTVKIVHDALRKVIDDRTFLHALDRYGQEPYYMSPAAYLDFARRAFANEKELVERLGLGSSK